MSWIDEIKLNFEKALDTYRMPLFLLTSSTFFILLARVFSVSAAVSTTMLLFIIGSLNLLAAGISAAYSIVRYE